MCVSVPPATPPGMRVRTGRFEELRSWGQPGHAQLAEQRVRERDVDRHRGVVPPAPAIGRHTLGRVVAHPAREARGRWSCRAASV